MSREWRLRLVDITEACEAITEFTVGMNRDDFLADRRTRDAVIRNLEIIGEAAKLLPPAAKAQAPQIDWRRIAGFRDVLIHNYFAVDPDIVWDVVETKIDDLRSAVQALLTGSI